MNSCLIVFSTESERDKEKNYIDTHTHICERWIYIKREKCEQEIYTKQNIKQ